MAEGRKGAPEKQVLAWRLCRHTAVRQRPVSERLRMGDESRATRAMRRVQVQPGAELEGLKERLEQAYLGGEGDLADARAESVFSVPGPFRFARLRGRVLRKAISL